MNTEPDLATVTPGTQGYAAGGSLSELEGSTPTNMGPIRYELPATTPAKSSHRAPIELDSSCELGHSHSSKACSSVRCLGRPGRARAVSAYAIPEPYIPMLYPAQPPSAGLIAVQQYAPLPAQHYPHDTTPPHRACTQPIPTYDDGLMLADDNASTPKEPSSDSDAILRNIGPISKKNKGKLGRVRSSRYYDRYFNNFG